MKEFIEKLIGRLEEELKLAREMQTTQCIGHDGYGTPLQSKLGGEICALLKVQSIVNQLAEEYNNGWIPCNDQLPPHSDDLLLVQCNGKPRNNINFVNAFCLASYTEEGWTLEMYPDWRDAEVVAWKNLGEPYQPKGE